MPSLKMHKYIIANCSGGLCNRIRCLISSMRLAEKLSKPLILFWPVNPGCACQFSDLFENELDEIDEQKMHSIRSDGDHYIVEPSRLATLPKDKIPYNFGASWHREFPFDHIDCEYDRTPLRARCNILPYIHSLIPKKFITEKVKQFSDTFVTKTLGVSLRTWTDAIRYRYDRREHLFDFDKICSTIDNIRPETIFVASDSEEAFMKIKEKYKDKILYVSKRTFWGDRGSKEGIEDCFVDQLLLSKCNILIGGYLSTYVEMAWWFGDCKAKVFII